jgi:hypothetical protein
MNPTQERLLATLMELTKLFPEWRHGQMICNLTSMAKFEESTKDPAGTIWDIEDEELLAAAEEFLAKCRRSLQSSNEPAA